MVDAGDDTVVLETTSHGLALDRVGGVAYDVAILTNVTHEHLELHGTWEAYRDAKLSLFARLARGNPRAHGHRQPRRPVGRRVHRRGRAAAPGSSPTARTRPPTSGRPGQRGCRGLHAAIETPDGPAELDLRLAGRFNVHNALAVVALGEALGPRPRQRPRRDRGPRRVPGRMERIDAGQPFGVIVDFAHSPASLPTVLDLLAPTAAARGGGMVAVFGSAGERDTAKRAVMGRIAGERARLVVVTDEDPRGEDRDAILDEIARGRRGGRPAPRPGPAAHRRRRAAIAAAFEAARPGDIVLLAGKGHETTIAGAQGDEPWDEVAVAVETLAAMGFPG